MTKLGTLLLLSAGITLFGCGAQQQADEENNVSQESASNPSGLGEEQDALWSGTCTKGTSTCIGRAYYATPDNGANYCDPYYSYDGTCTLVASGRCNYESGGICGGMPRGTHCLPGSNFCKSLYLPVGPYPTCYCG
jgi:hypothetical protein